MPTDIKTAESRQRVQRFSLAGWGALTLSIIVLAATVWAVYANWIAAKADADRAQANRVYLRALNNVRSYLDDAESAQRGYLLTGRERYLEPYHRALPALKDTLKVLAQVAKDRPDQKPRLDHLQELVRTKLVELDETVRLHQAQGRDGALTTVLTDRGLLLMNQIREVTRSAVEEQRSDAATRTAESERREKNTILLGGAGALILLCLIAAGTFALTTSATEQAHLTESLADANEIFETTLTSIGDGVVATDLTGSITFINPEAARLCGCLREEAVGKSLDEVLKLINETSRTRVESPFAKVIETSNVVGLANHTLLVRPDGSEVPIDDSGAPIRNVQGIINGVVLVFRGVEDRRKTEASLKTSNDELLKANEELRQFSYAATHDLQEPLRTIVVFSQLLRRNYKQTLDERGQHLLQTIEEAGHRMSALVEDLLAFTRVESSDPVAPQSAISATEILQDTLIQLNGAIEETKARVHFGELPKVWTEPAKLSQLFQNLISNSIKYRRPEIPPVIRISSSVDGEFATFQISDNGIGFKQDYAERIFLLFQRLHGRSIPGTGIGLALCRRIVERQGGKIWANSVENEGSTFFFTLPRARDEG